LALPAEHSGTSPPMSNDSVRSMVAWMEYNRGSNRGVRTTLDRTFQAFRQPPRNTQQLINGAYTSILVELNV
jgi:hypothetical protein